MSKSTYSSAWHTVILRKWQVLLVLFSRETQYPTVKADAAAACCKWMSPRAGKKPFCTALQTQTKQKKQMD